MTLKVRQITTPEMYQLEKWAAGANAELCHRARVILLCKQGYGVPEIAELTNHHPTNLRRWIHRFNREGTKGLESVHRGGGKQRITLEVRQAIVQLAREGRPTGKRWTLHSLADEVVRLGILRNISHETTRQILKEAGITLCRSS